MKPLAVITARAGSKRIPWKNMLPLGGQPLAEIAIRHALNAGLYPIVTSDIDAVLKKASELGALAVRRPAEYCNGDKHFESIRHAVHTAVTLDPSKQGEPVVLLQPTSPFRFGSIIEKCLAAHSKTPDKVVLSGRDIHYVDASGKPVKGGVWDGCVAVYPQAHIGHQEGAVIVENEHLNMLQVDTEEDYIQACIQHWRINGHWLPLGGEEAKLCISELAPLLKGQSVTLVGRPDGKPIDQTRPVVWLNHCNGWDGGRADVLVVVGSSNITKVGINKELAEVAEKAKVVIIRDIGKGEWVDENLKVGGKKIMVKTGKTQVTTGAFASALIMCAGGRTQTLGFQRGVSRIPYCAMTFPDPLVSQEIALLEVSGESRQS